MSIMDRARYNVTQPTLNDGQDSSLQVDVNGKLYVISQYSQFQNPTKAEDAASASADIGMFVLAIRQDTPVALTNTNGDYTGVVTNQYGDLKVDIVDATGTEITYNANGQATMANSTPVVIASNQSVIPVGGDIASGVADSGSPIKIGGVALNAMPVFTNGQRANASFTLGGALIVGGTTLVPSDAMSNAASSFPSSGSNAGLPFINFGTAWNGASWDRIRNAGVAGSGLLVENGPYTASRKTADGQVKGSAGFVHTISIAPTTATPTAGLLTVYDSLTETGTVLYSEWVFATTVGHTITLDVAAATGIFVGYDATLTNVSCTVAFR